MKWFPNPLQDRNQCYSFLQGDAQSLYGSNGMIADYSFRIEAYLWAQTPSFASVWILAWYLIAVTKKPNPSVQTLTCKTRNNTSTYVVGCCND